MLLLADEQESMIDRYLDTGDMFVLFNGKIAIAVAVVTEYDKGVCEIKNLAVIPNAQRQGYGRKMMSFIEEHYKSQYHTILVGTGDSPLTIPFYKECGYDFSHTIKNFFLENYDHPIFEGGTQLVDMIYLKKVIR